MKYCNQWWPRARKQDENEAGLPFSLRSTTREVRDYCILERIAYLQVESNTERMDGWMDGAGIYKTNTSEYYNSVTAGFAQNSNHGFFFFHLMSPLWTCSSEWMQESRSVFLHRFLKYFAGNISENVWQLSRHVNKAFIYSRILKFRERISRGKF